MTSITTTYTRQEAEAAFWRAFAAAEDYTGDDAAMDSMAMHGIANLLGAAETVTREQAVAAYNTLAEDAKAEYNPDGGENGDSIRADSCGDLVVNLAAGFLDDPEATAYDVIASSWSDLDPADMPEEAGPERDAAIVAEVKSWF